VKQIAFSIGNFNIYWYAILVTLGFLAGLWTASRRCLADGLPGETIVDLGPWLMLGAIVGARALHVISYWREDYAHEPIWEIFAIRHGGLVFYGGLIGASLTTVFYARVRQLPLWKLADAMAPSIALGQAFGRVGCLMNGCCYGTACTLPWAIRFPSDHPTHHLPVHPTEIYEALLNAGLYLGLAWFYGRRRFTGQVFALYLVAYACVRFLVEFFRGDYEVHYLGGWATPGQLVSLVMAAAGLWLWHTLGRSRPVAPEAAS